MRFPQRVAHFNQFQHVLFFKALVFQVDLFCFITFAKVTITADRPTGWWQDHNLIKRKRVGGWPISSSEIFDVSHPFRFKVITENTKQIMIFGEFI